MRAKQYIAAAVFICAALSVLCRKHHCRKHHCRKALYRKPHCRKHHCRKHHCRKHIAEKHFTESRITAALNIIRSHEDAVEIPVAESLAGHSFYPDILLSPSQEPSLILVVSLPADTDIINASIAAVSNTVAVLFVAPRNTPNASWISSSKYHRHFAKHTSGSYRKAFSAYAYNRQKREYSAATTSEGNRYPRCAGQCFPPMACSINT